MNASIHWNNETNERLPVDANDFTTIVEIVEAGESCSYRLLEVVIVPESQIIEINKQYLDRDYLTDIITFRYDKPGNNQQIEGTLFCCWPRIREQASSYEVDPVTELHRILIHGLLHLAGYEDKDSSEKQLMRKRENYYLGKLNKQ